MRRAASPARPWRCRTRARRRARADPGRDEAGEHRIPLGGLVAVEGHHRELIEQHATAVDRPRREKATLLEGVVRFSGLAGDGHAVQHPNRARRLAADDQLARRHPRRRRIADVDDVVACLVKDDHRRRAQVVDPLDVGRLHKAPGRPRGGALLQRRVRGVQQIELAHLRDVSRRIVGRHEPDAVDDDQGLAIVRQHDPTAAALERAGAADPRASGDAGSATGIGELVGRIDALERILRRCRRRRRTRRKRPHRHRHRRHFRQSSHPSPPVQCPTSYLIAASALEDFASRAKRIVSVPPA